MREVGLELGKDYEAITVSIDPKDTPAQSQARRRRHLQAMGKPETRSLALPHRHRGEHPPARRGGWLQVQVRRSSKQYAHPAVVHVLTPEGSVSRYLYGTSFPAKDMKLALVEASERPGGDELRPSGSVLFQV